LERGGKKKKYKRGGRSLSRGKGKKKKNVGDDTRKGSAIDLEPDWGRQLQKLDGNRGKKPRIRLWGNGENRFNEKRDQKAPNKLKSINRPTSIMSRFWEKGGGGTATKGRGRKKALGGVCGGGIGPWKISAWLKKPDKRIIFTENNRFLGVNTSPGEW